MHRLTIMRKLGLLEKLGVGATGANPLSGLHSEQELIFLIVPV